MSYHHWWSGWPGAWCMKCGAEHLLEIAIGCGYYDPFTDTWDTEEHRAEYTDGPCPISNAEYTQKTGHVIPPDPTPTEEP